MAIVKINWRPNRRQLRTFGFACLLAFSAVGLVAFLRHSIFGIDLTRHAARTTSIVLGSVALLCGFSALALPQALRPLYLLLNAIAFPIGLVLSHVIMGVLYYVLLTPIGLIFRLVGRDVLHRKADPGAPSYWVRRRKVSDMKRYFNQF